VKARYDIDGPALATSFSTLWEIFLKVIGDARSGPIGVIVDAIDECEQATRRIFLDAVSELIHKYQETGERPRNYIKFLITSRPSLGHSYDFNGFLQSKLPLENNQGSTSEDIRLVIKRKVEQIVRKSQSSDEMRTFLEQALYSKADKTFLWVDFVLGDLEKSPLASKKDFEQIIDRFPRELEAIYRRFLQHIHDERRDEAAKILRLLVGSSRHLNLVEANFAFTIHDRHRVVEEIKADCQPSMVRTLQVLAGPFLRVSDSEVSLIHQSVKEFLTDLALRPDDPLAYRYGVDSAKASLSLACSCIWYLLLQDFAVDLFSEDKASVETTPTGSPVSPVLPRTGSNMSEAQFDPLRLEEIIIFRDPRTVEAEACASIASRYAFFDYAATHWGEHLSACEESAPDDIQEAVMRLTRKKSLVLTNWLKYFWVRTSMEYPFPDYFDTVIVSALFNLSLMLDNFLQREESTSQSTKDWALFWAARMGSAKSVKVLLRHDANPNARGIERHSPLTIAAQHGHIHAVRNILDDQRTDVNLKEISGRSALSIAAGNGQRDVVQALLGHEDCQPDAVNNSNSTPLLQAVLGDHTDVIVNLLENRSVDVNHVDKTGRSAISWAAGESFLKSLKVLLKHPQSNPNLKDYKGRSPLLWAAANGRSRVVSHLLRHNNVDRSSKDIDQRNAISLACQGGHADTVKTLIKYECPGIDEEDVDGWTPLPWALESRSLVTVETLILPGRVDVNHRDRTGRTALLWAASYGYLDVVQFLLLEGASVSVVDNSGMTPVSVAKMYGYTEIVEALETRLAEEKSKQLVGS
jgi:ankyrin repeat protein